MSFPPIPPYNTGMQPPLSEWLRRHNFPKSWIARISLRTGVSEDYRSDPDQWVSDMLDWSRDQFNAGYPIRYFSFETNFDAGYDCYQGANAVETWWDYNDRLQGCVLALNNRRFDLMRAGVELAARIRWDYISDPCLVPDPSLHSWIHRDVFELALERLSTSFRWNEKYERKLERYYDEFAPWLRDWIPRPYSQGDPSGGLYANASHPQFRTTLLGQVDSLRKLARDIRASAIYTEWKSFAHTQQWEPSSDPQSQGPSIVSWGHGREWSGLDAYPIHAQDMTPGEFEALQGVVHAELGRSYHIVSGYNQLNAHSRLPNDFDLAGAHRDRHSKAGRRDGWPGQK